MCIRDRWFPGRAAGGELGVVDEQIQCPGAHVEADPVTVPDQRDRTTGGGFGGYVPDTQTGGAAGEPAIGEQQHVLAQAGALDSAGDVVVIRWEGPKGGPGMREMLAVTGAIKGAGLGKDVLLLTDGRFSGC